MKLPVVKAFSATFAFVFSHYADVLKVVLVPVAVLAGLGYWVNAKMVPLQMHAMQIDAHQDPIGRLQAMAPVFKWLALVFVAALILYPMIYSGLLRLVVRGQKPGFIYLRFASDELRMLLTFVLVVLLFVAIAIGGAVVVALAGLTLSAVSKAAAGIAALVACLALVIFFIWVDLRLSLCFAATIGAEGIGIGPSWSATKGASWALFFYWLLWIVLIGVVAGVFFAVLYPEYFSGVLDLVRSVQMHRGDPEGVQNTMNQWQLHNLEAMASKAPLIAAGSFLYGIVIRPLIVVAGGVAYRLLTEGSVDEAAAA